MQVDFFKHNLWTILPIKSILPFAAFCSVTSITPVKPFLSDFKLTKSKRNSTVFKSFELYHYPLSSAIKVTDKNNIFIIHRIFCNLLWYFSEKMTQHFRVFGAYTFTNVIILLSCSIFNSSILPSVDLWWSNSSNWKVFFKIETPLLCGDAE